MRRVFLVVTLLFLGWNNIILGQTTFQDELVSSAKLLTNDNVIYDAAYFSIDYPNGDVPKDRGVCTDVIIRSYRKLGIDLQKEIHEDMSSNFNQYPNIWGLLTTDKNIDHRRVPNMMKFFERKGQMLPITNKSSDYKPGDIVCWSLGGAITHIGIVIDDKSKIDGNRHLIVHNIGVGQVKEDCLFNFKIIGHYRYFK